MQNANNPTVQTLPVVCGVFTLLSSIVVICVVTINNVEFENNFLQFSQSQSSATLNRIFSQRSTAVAPSPTTSNYLLNSTSAPSAPSPTPIQIIPNKNTTSVLKHQFSSVLVVDIGINGLGSTLNYFVYVNFHAQASSKFIRLMRSYPQHFNCETASWECYFEPLPGSKVKDLTNERVPYDTSVGSRAFCQDIHNQAIAENLSHQFNCPECIDNKYLLARKSWKQIWKPNLRMKAKVENATHDLELQHPSVAVHVRRGDKLNAEATLVPVQEYVDLIEGIGTDFKTVFIFTDDFRVIQEFKDLRGDWNIKSLATPGMEGYDWRRFNTKQKAESSEALVVEMLIASKCDYFVGTASSNAGAMVQLIREQHLTTALNVDYPLINKTWSVGTHQTSCVAMDLNGTIVDTSSGKWRTSISPFHAL